MRRQALALRVEGPQVGVEILPRAADERVSVVRVPLAAEEDPQVCEQREQSQIAAEDVVIHTPGVAYTGELVGCVLRIVVADVVAEDQVVEDLEARVQALGRRSRRRDRRGTELERSAA